MARTEGEKEEGDNSVSYDPDYFFFDVPKQKEPRPFTYRARSFADVAVRLSQSHKGIPAVAPRLQADSLCRNCGERKADHGGKRNPSRACPRFVSPWGRKRPARKGIITTHQTSKGETAIMTKQEATGIRPRPITTGLHGTADDMAEQLFQAWRLLTQDRDVGEISDLTGIRQELVAALADRFW
jgi:hypothetical protein